jgi:hypothetical protein
MTPLINRTCSNKHDICINNVNYFKTNMAGLTTQNFDKFIDIILQNGGYNNCLSSYSNKQCDVLMQFIVLASGMIPINVVKFISLCQYTQVDEHIKNIIANQCKLNKNYKSDIVFCKTAKNYYGSATLFMSQCVSSRKTNTFKFMLTDISVNTFFEIINQIKDSIPTDYDKFLNEYILLNHEAIKTYDKLNTVIESLINKPKILKNIYSILAPSLTPDKKLDILNKVVITASPDPELILVIMEGKDICATNITLINLVSKTYFRNTGAPNSKTISEIIDIFIMYGYVLTKDVIIMLLRKGCYVNKIEKYDIPIDESILEVCAELSYYPYDFSCIPPPKVMLKECSKSDNLIQIKKLKEKGGILNVQCLEKACAVKKNGKVIKYIINECKVKPNDKCLEEFQNTHGIEALDLLMQNYSNLKEENKNIKELNLDNESTMTIERRNIEINDTDEYIIKKKIKKFFDYKKNTINITELSELMLKYLISKKLIIGNYFLINNELCNLTKINQCTIVNIDQLENMLSYFVDKSS